MKQGRKRRNEGELDSIRFRAISLPTGHEAVVRQVFRFDLFSTLKHISSLLRAPNPNSKKFPSIAQAPPLSPSPPVPLPLISPSLLPPSHAHNPFSFPNSFSPPLFQYGGAADAVADDALELPDAPIASSYPGTLFRSSRVLWILFAPPNERTRVELGPCE